MSKTVYEFAKSVGAEISIKPTLVGSYSAHLLGAEISGRNGKLLTGATGFGPTEREAVIDLTKQLRGQRIVFNATGPDRREYNVDQALSSAPPPKTAEQSLRERVKDAERDSSRLQKEVLFLTLEKGLALRRVEKLRAAFHEMGATMELNGHTHSYKWILEQLAADDKMAKEGG